MRTWLVLYVEGGSFEEGYESRRLSEIAKMQKVQDNPSREVPSADASHSDQLEISSTAIVGRPSFERWIGHCAPDLG